MHPIKHFKTITKHRHAVIRNCFKAGIPLQGLRHDLSKYLLRNSSPAPNSIREQEAPMRLSEKNTDIPPHGFITKAEINIILNIGLITIPPKGGLCR